MNFVKMCQFVVLLFCSWFYVLYFCIFRIQRLFLWIHTILQVVRVMSAIVRGDWCG